MCILTIQEKTIERQSGKEGKNLIYNLWEAVLAQIFICSIFVSE